jgi:hypothetical protein
MVVLLSDGMAMPIATVFVAIGLRLRMKLSGNARWTRAQYAGPQKAALGVLPLEATSAPSSRRANAALKTIKLMNR